MDRWLFESRTDTFHGNLRRAPKYTVSRAALFHENCLKSKLIRSCFQTLCDKSNGGRHAAFVLTREEQCAWLYLLEQVDCLAGGYAFLTHVEISRRTSVCGKLLRTHGLGFAIWQMTGGGL